MILNQILSTILTEMYGDQSGEFVCGSWGTQIKCFMEEDRRDNSNAYFVQPLAGIYLIKRFYVVVLLFSNRVLDFMSKCGKVVKTKK